MNEQIDVPLHMHKIITKLAEVKELSVFLVMQEATTIRDYKLALAVASEKHKSSGLPATLVKTQAEKDAADNEFDMNMAKGALKAHWIYIGILQSQLNGYQSINRTNASI
jgi:hypothetical protein